MITDRPLSEAKELFLQQVDKGTHCPCCGRYTKVYRRKLNAGLALFLIRASRKYGDKWFHVNHDVKDHREFNADYGKLEYWGLIEPMSPTDKRPTSGYWRVTDKGRQFVRGEIALPAYMLVLNNKVLEAAQACIDIRDALRSGGFDYAELMNAA
jgi:hypothetical protein